MKKALSLSMALAMSAATTAALLSFIQSTAAAKGVPAPMGRERLRRLRLRQHLRFQRCFLCGQRCLRHPHRQLYDPRLHRPCAEQ